jgi:hypothetical protein
MTVFVARAETLAGAKGFLGADREIASVRAFSLRLTERLRKSAHAGPNDARQICPRSGMGTHTARLVGVADGNAKAGQRSCDQAANWPLDLARQPLQKS